MKNQISSYADLKEWGIIYLTSEACGMSLRQLCDLTEKGKEIIENFFGMNARTSLPLNWNSGAVASIFLTHGILLDIAAFCLLQENDVVMINREKGYASGMDQETYQKIIGKDLDEYKNCRFVFKEGTARNGFSNRHEFSGRVQ